MIAMFDNDFTYTRINATPHVVRIKIKLPKDFKLKFPLNFASM